MEKTGRNDPCPCGSGKKYKKCCLPKINRYKEKYAENSKISFGKDNILKETKYIIKRALKNDSRIVGLGRFVLFSTQTGDAWLLEPADSSALCLVKNGEIQNYRIIESGSKFMIDWPARYEIVDDTFVVYENSGRVLSIHGYPIKDIIQHIKF